MRSLFAQFTIGIAQYTIGIRLKSLHGPYYCRKGPIGNGQHELLVVRSARIRSHPHATGLLAYLRGPYMPAPPIEGVGDIRPGGHQQTRMCEREFVCAGARLLTRMRVCKEGIVRQRTRVGMCKATHCALKPKPSKSMAYTGRSWARLGTLSRQCSKDAPKPATWCARVRACLHSLRTAAPRASCGASRWAERLTVHEQQRRVFALGVHDGVPHLHVPPLPVHSLPPIRAPRHRGCSKSPQGRAQSHACRPRPEAA